MAQATVEQMLAFQNARQQGASVEEARAVANSPTPPDNNYTYTDSGRGNYSHAHAEAEKRKNSAANPKASYLEQQYEEYTERGRGHESYARSNYLAEAVNDAQTKGRGTQSYARTSYLEDAVNAGNPIEQTTETAMHDQMAKNADVSKVQGEIDEYRELMKTADDAAVFSRKASNNQYEDAQGVIAKANADAEEARAKAQEIAERLERNYGITVNGTRVDASGFYNSYFAKEMEAAKKAASEKPVDTIAMLLGQDAEYMDASTTDMLRSASEDEKQLYRYLLEQDKVNGTKIADIYRTYLEDTQARERGTEIAKNIEAKDEGVGKALSYGARAVASGASNALNAVRDTITGEQGARGVNEYAAGELRQGLADEGRNTAAFFFDAAQSVGAMTPGLVAGFANPALGAAVFATTTGASSYQDKLDEGWTQSDAAAYGVLTAIAEGGLQYVTGGVGKLAMKNNLVKAVVDKVTNTAGKPLLHAIANAAGRAGGEAIEEIAQTYIEPAIVSVLTGTPYDTPETREALRAGLLGAVTSLGLGGGEFVGDIRNANAQGTQNANNAPEAVGNEMTPPTAQEAAQTASGEFNPQAEPNEAVVMLLEIANRGRVNNSTAAQIAKSPELSEAFSRMYSAELGGAPLSGTLNQRQTAIQNAVRQRANAEANNRVGAQTAVDESANALAEYSVAEAARENTLEQAAADMTEREAANNNYASYIRGVIQNGATAKEAKTILDTPELRALWETMTGVTLPASRNKATNAIMSSRRNVGIDALLETAKVVPTQPEVALEAPLSPQNTPKNIAEIAPESVEYTIERDNAGDVTIHINKAMLDNVPRENWEKVVRGKIQAIFKNGITLPRGTIYSNKKGRGEFSNGSYTRMLERTEPDLYRAKMNMASGTGAMVENAKNVKSEPPAHDRADDIVAFNRGNIRVVVDGKSYTGDVLTAIYKDGKEVFFDVNNIAKEKTEATPERYAAVGGFSQTGAAPASKGFPLNVSINATAPAVNTSMQSKPADGEIKERSYPQTLANDAGVNPELRKRLADDPEVYRVAKNKSTLQKAQDIYDQGLDVARSTLDRAIQSAQDGNSKLSLEMIPLAQKVANDLSAQGKVDEAQRLIADIAAELTQAGQFIQAASILLNRTPASVRATIQKAIDKVNSAAKVKGWKAELTPSEIDLINKTDFTQEGAFEQVYETVFSRIGQEMPATLWEKLTEIRRINMLLRPRTMIKNVAGNAPMVVLRKASEKLSGMIQDQLVKSGKLDASEQTRTGRTISKTSREVANKAYEEAKEVINGRSNRWDANSIIREHRTIFKPNAAISKALNGLTGKDADAQRTAFLESARNFTYELLEKGDAPFVKSAFTDSLASYCEAHNISDTNNVPQEAIDLAIADAMDATFKSETVLGNMLNQLKRKGGFAGAALDVLFPFTTTPINITRQMGAYSPVGLITALNIARDGNLPKAIDAASRGLVGSAAMGLGFLGRALGWLTGGEDEDKDKSAWEKATGKGIYSIGGTVSYDWVQPFGSLLALGAEIYDATAENKKWIDAVMNALYVAGDSVLNLSIFQNVTSLLKGSGSPTEKTLETLATSLVSQGIPGLAGDIAKIIDGTVRSTYTGGNVADDMAARAMSSIPGLTSKLPESVNVKGETNARGGLLERMVNVLVNPATITKGEKNEVDLAVEALYEETGSKAIFPDVSPYSFDAATGVDVPGGKVVLDGKERETFQKTQGTTYYELLGDIISGDIWSNANATTKAQIISEVKSLALDRAKQEYYKNNGLEGYSSEWEKLTQGVDKPGQDNDLPALKANEIPEYLAYKSGWNVAMKNDDYATLDRLTTAYNNQGANIQTWASKFDGISSLLKVVGLETSSGHSVGSKDWYTVQSAIDNALVSLDVENEDGFVDAQGFANAKLPEDVKDTLAPYVLTENRNLLHTGLRSVSDSLTAEDILGLFEAADAPTEKKPDGNGTLAQKELGPLLRNLISQGIITDKDAGNVWAYFQENNTNFGSTSWANWKRKN